MARLVCVVIGVGVTFTLKFRRDELIETFPERFMTAAKETFDPREVVLYPAKQDGKWLSARDVAALKRGSVPALVQAITTPNNQLDPKSPVIETVFGAEFASVHRKSDLHVLVDVPEYIKNHLRITYAGQIIYRKWFYYHAFILGIYLCNRDENLVRGGVLSDCNPANGKLLSVGIPGVVMWLSLLSSVVLKLAKVCAQRKRDKHDVSIH